MSSMPRLIRVCCNNNADELEILNSIGYRVKHYSLNHNYLHLNIWFKLGNTEYKQTGLLLKKEDLEVIALLPTIDAVENYIYILQDEAAAKFNEAEKE